MDVHVKVESVWICEQRRNMIYFFPKGGRSANKFRKPQIHKFADPIFFVICGLLTNIAYDDCIQIYSS